MNELTSWAAENFSDKQPESKRPIIALNRFFYFSELVCFKILKSHNLAWMELWVLNLIKYSFYVRFKVAIVSCLEMVRY